MTSQIVPEIRRELVEFVHARIGLIRTGDRPGLEQTYCPMSLSLRNEYNRHDYDWYMNLIEDGFGVNLERLDIELIQQQTPLPFPGMTTFSSVPHYKVKLTTVTGRNTLWVIRFPKEGPKIALPAFNGSVADSVALGSYPWHQTPKPSEEAVSLVEFDPADFTLKLAEDITFRLKHVWYQHRFETLRAVTLDCHPWHPVLSICLLTTQEGEDFQEEKYGKWDIAAWRLFHVTDLNKSLQQFIYDYSLGNTTTDQEGSEAHRVETILSCCARALQHPTVQESLAKFQQAADFEVVLFHPDDGDCSQDYCQQSE